MNSATTSWWHNMRQKVSCSRFCDIRPVKVTVEYSIKLWLEFSKTNGRKKGGWFVNVLWSRLTLSTPIWNLAHQSFRIIIVRFVSWDSKLKYANVISKWAELSDRTYKLSCVKLYNLSLIVDEIAITINSTIQYWAPSNWGKLAKRSICKYAILCIQHADWSL